MAQIDIQRKGGTSWLWWLLGLIVLVLLLWWAISALTGPREAAVVAPVAPVGAVTPGAAATTPGVAVPAIVVVDIVRGPEAWVGRTVSGTAPVAEVPTDRGFWVGTGGDRLFVILNDAPAERPIDINPGQTVQLTDAVVMNDVAKVPGEIDADTRRIAEGQTVFLNVDESNVQTVAQAGAAGGTQP